MFGIGDRVFLNNVKKMINPPVKKVKKKESQLFDIKCPKGHKICKCGNNKNNKNNKIIKNNKNNKK